MNEERTKFQRRAATHAASLLDTVVEIAADTNSPSSVRLESVKWLAKTGTLEPRQTPDEPPLRVNITIELGGGNAPLVIDVPTNPVPMTPVTGQAFDLNAIDFDN
jgi:hypothetical protein